MGSLTMKGVITRGILFGILILVVFNQPQCYVDATITQQEYYLEY